MEPACAGSLSVPVERFKRIESTISLREIANRCTIYPQILSAKMMQTFERYENRRGERVRVGVGVVHGIEVSDSCLLVDMIIYLSFHSLRSQVKDKESI